MNKSINCVNHEVLKISHHRQVVDSEVHGFCRLNRLSAFGFYSSSGVSCRFNTPPSVCVCVCVCVCLCVCVCARVRVRACVCVERGVASWYRAYIYLFIYLFLVVERGGILGGILYQLCPDQPKYCHTLFFWHLLHYNSK